MMSYYHGELSKLFHNELIDQQLNLSNAHEPLPDTQTETQVNRPEAGSANLGTCIAGRCNNSFTLPTILYVMHLQSGPTERCLRQGSFSPRSVRDLKVSSLWATGFKWLPVRSMAILGPVHALREFIARNVYEIQNVYKISLSTLVLICLLCLAKPFWSGGNLC